MAVPKSKKSFSKSKIKRFNKQKLMLKTFKICNICGFSFITTKCLKCQNKFKSLIMA